MFQIFLTLGTIRCKSMILNILFVPCIWNNLEQRLTVSQKVGTLSQRGKNRANFSTVKKLTVGSGKVSKN
jgi:hypothetical protein